VVIGCFLFLRERLRASRVICAVLGLLGVALFYIPALHGAISIPGLTLALCSGVAYTGYVLLLGSRRLNAISPLRLVFYFDLINGIVITLCGLVFQKISFPSMLLARRYLLVVVVLDFGAALLFQGGIRRLGPQRGAIISTLEPLTTIVVGGLFLGERLTWLTGVACSLILISIIFSVLPGYRRQKSW
jgi:drug/metabolite transporter (DMT)-like permease